MPHQCLSCGRVFASGSKELLKGCPSCQGTRFFFTNEPLGETDRQALIQKSNQDLRSLITELMAEGRPDYADAIWSAGKRKEWLELGKRLPTVSEAVAITGAGNEVRGTGNGETAAVKEIDEVAPPAPKPTIQVTLEASAPAAPAAAAAAPEGAAPVAAAAATAPGKHSKPEVVSIVRPGTYELDLEALLEKSPIIVGNDGVYMIHLPSVFHSVPKKSGR
ncbi:MAG: OapC/ArvC family zinc-ribbon domain-containing protein [Methanobacteriota archaeon]